MKMLTSTPKSGRILGNKVPKDSELGKCCNMIKSLQAAGKRRETGPVDEDKTRLFWSLLPERQAPAKVPLWTGILNCLGRLA